MKNLSVLAIPSVCWREDFLQELIEWWHSHLAVLAESIKFTEFMENREDRTKDDVLHNLGIVLYDTSSAVQEWVGACRLDLPPRVNTTVWAAAACDLQCGPGDDSKYEYFELINDCDMLMGFLEQRAQLTTYYRLRLQSALGLPGSIAIAEDAVVTQNSVRARVASAYYWSWLYLESQALVARADVLSSDGVATFAVTRLGCRRLGLTMDQTRAAIALG